MNAVVQRYTALLNALVWETSNLQTDSTVRFTPYYFRLFAPGTLYDAPMKQEFGVKWNFTLPGREKNVPSLLDYRDKDRLVLEEENRMLMQAYVRTPWLIQTTEDDLEKAGGLQKEVLPELPAVTHLVENEINVDLTQDVDTIRLKVRRP